MEAGLWISWGKPVPGHEQEAIGLIGEAIQFLTNKKDFGYITWFEAFMPVTTDYDEEVGFFVIKGPAEKIDELRFDENWLYLLTKAGVLVNHFKVSYLRVGDAVPEQIDRVAKVYAELGV